MSRGRGRGGGRGRGIAGGYVFEAEMSHSLDDFESPLLFPVRDPPLDLLKITPEDTYNVHKHRQLLKKMQSSVFYIKESIVTEEVARYSTRNNNRIQQRNISTWLSRDSMEQYFPVDLLGTKGKRAVYKGSGSALLVSLGDPLLKATDGDGEGGDKGSDDDEDGDDDKTVSGEESDDGDYNKDHFESDGADDDGDADDGPVM